jgi:hypothetical protein
MGDITLGLRHPAKILIFLVDADQDYLPLMLIIIGEHLRTRILE